MKNYHFEPFSCRKPLQSRFGQKGITDSHGSTLKKHKKSLIRPCKSLSKNLREQTKVSGGKKDQENGTMPTTIINQIKIYNQNQIINYRDPKTIEIGSQIINVRAQPRKTEFKKQNQATKLPTGKYFRFLTKKKRKNYQSQKFLDRNRLIERQNQEFQKDQNCSIHEILSQNDKTNEKQLNSHNETNASRLRPSLSLKKLKESHPSFIGKKYTQQVQNSRIINNVKSMPFINVPKQQQSQDSYKNYQKQQSKKNEENITVPSSNSLQRSEYYYIQKLNNARNQNIQLNKRVQDFKQAIRKNEVQMNQYKLYKHGYLQVLEQFGLQDQQVIQKNHQMLMNQIYQYKKDIQQIADKLSKTGENRQKQTLVQKLPPNVNQSEIQQKQNQSQEELQRHFDQSQVQQQIFHNKDQQSKDKLLQTYKKQINFLNKELFKIRMESLVQKYK